jgi:hypothetical protein
MIFESDDQAAEYIKANRSVSPYIVKSREQTKELKALIAGKDFNEILISKIEHIEGEKRAQARKKYSRAITDFFERLLRPIDNIYHSNGGSKTYNISNEDIKKKVLKTISKIRNDQSLQNWLETNWMGQYHKDPSGIIFLEYTTEEGEFIPYPTYKSTNVIRNYIPNGQNVEVLLFEPVKSVKDNGDVITKWRIVDDLVDRTFLVDGDSLTLIEDETFEHPFGQVPAIINSNIIDIDETPFKRLSPIEPIRMISREFARDTSIKTIYKFLQGIPVHWRYVTKCKSCQGTGKTGDHKCKTCDGKGFYSSKDVTDMVTIPTPKPGDVTITPDIAGYISPDLDTWKQYNEETESLESLSEKTLWGTIIEHGQNETATGRFIDVQPVMNKLNKYADYAQWVEQQLTEWIINGFDPLKPKDKRVSMISYGRRYIIEGPDVILAKYEEAKKNSSNSVILDRLFNEYLTSKFKNDPEWLRLMLIKSEVEPYLHYSVDQISRTFGIIEAQKKMLFESWWKTLMPNEILSKSSEQLKIEFETWLESNLIQPDQTSNQ